MPSPSTEVNSGPQFPLKRPSVSNLCPPAPVATPEPPSPVAVSAAELPVEEAETERPPAQPSEETSFTQLPSENGGSDKEDRKARRRGMVETV
jgi:hypothetical protein